MAPSNPDVLYARYTDSFGSIQGVYRTNNGGQSWREVNSSQLTNVGFHWWFRGLYVDPTDEDILYNVDFVVEKSTNGGQSWFTAFPNVHVDQHALAFSPENNGEILLGNDGGVYKSSDDGVSSTKYLNLPITQFYRFHVDPQNSRRIYGGSQDNSTMRTTTNGLSDWDIIYGGDGFQTLVDNTNSDVIYALSQRGNLVKSTNDGLSFSSATLGVDFSDRNNWDTPIVFDPKDNQTLYYGTQRVWETTDATASWTAISPDLTNGSGGGNLTFGTITTIDVSPVNSEVIVVGTDDSNVWITQDGGDNWNWISETLPNLWTTKVLADRNDQETLYVTFSGYRYAEDGSHVFRSTDAGITWEDIGNGLPDIPVNDIVKDVHGSLYIATDVGVYLSINEGESWSPFDNNMPPVVVNDLHIDERAQLLYAATYGRSAYRSTIVEYDDEVDDVVTEAKYEHELEIYPNPASDYLTVSLPNVASTGFEVQGYNSYGQELFQTQVTDQSVHTLDISHLNSGIYYLKITSSDGTQFRKLVVR